MIPMILNIAMGCTVFLVVLLLSAVLFLRTSPESQRLQDIVASNRPDQRKLDQRQRLEESLLRLARKIRSQLGLGANAKVRERLEAAGLRDSETPDLFFAAQCLLPLAGAFAASFISRNTIFWVFTAAIACFVAPDLWLTERVKRRRRRILRSMPDAMDLLVICVDAGLGLDLALIRVGEELAFSHPEIHEELMRVTLEQRAGKPRLEAWQSLAARTGLNEFTAFVSMLTQTERFGTPISKALSRFADDIRLKRRQKAEEAAAKTKIKIIFPLVFFIFPSLFIVLLAPAMLSIADQLKGVGR
ncbi:MAG TPA: type II secretion system F family protein [Granulicella sp.]